MATKKGTSISDLLYWTDGDDDIYGYGGDDVIFAEGGNDYIEPGEGSDGIDGGDGNDTISYLDFVPYYTKSHGVEVDLAAGEATILTPWGKYESDPVRGQTLYFYDVAHFYSI